MNIICKIFGHNKKRKYWKISTAFKGRRKGYGCSRCGVIHLTPEDEYGWVQFKGDLK